jgi:hypothetical protein
VQLRPEYDDVPAVPADAELDPHWAELTAGRTSMLPLAYLPSAMPGRQTGWRRGAAIVVITMLVSATAGGICLTYGPGELFNLVRQ